MLSTSLDRDSSGIDLMIYNILRLAYLLCTDDDSRNGEECIINGRRMGKESEGWWGPCGT